MPERNLPGALRLFGESLRIRQRLAESDPAHAAWQRDVAARRGSATWQRDVAVSHHKLAMFSRQNGDDAGFETELRECFRVLDRMRQRGLHFDPQLAQLDQQLAGMFGGNAST